MKNKKYCVILFLILLFNVLNIFGENSKITLLDYKKIKNLELSLIYSEKVKKLNQNIKPGKQYLLLIGIDKYQNRLPLDIHVANAKELRNILYEEYYINEIIELYNEDATKENIVNAIKNLNNKLNFNDSVIIFYGGHGYIDPKTNKGYWIPHDGGINEILKDKWIPNEDIKSYISFLQASHVLLISDSSFSKDLINLNDSTTIDYQEEYFKNNIKNKSRQVLSSGVLEGESVESVFITRIKKFLKIYNKPYLNPEMIYNNIKHNIETSPYFGELITSGHIKGSSFIFYKRENDSVSKEYLVQLDKNEKIKNDAKEKDLTTDTFVKEKTEKQEKRKDELTINEEKLKQREQELEKKEEDVLALVYAKIVNKIGLSLCPIGATLTLSGLIIIAVDLSFYSRELENARNNLEDGNIQYSQYEKVYNNYIGLIVAGSALSAAGLIFVAVSIPLMVYKKYFKTISKLSLNLNMSENTSIFLSYKF